MTGSHGQAGKTKVQTHPGAEPDGNRHVPRRARPSAGAAVHCHAADLCRLDATDRTGPDVRADRYSSGRQHRVRELQRYLNDPSQFITGPKSTGKRDETAKSWKEHCEGDGRTLATHCPLKSAEWKCNFWDRIGATSGNLQGTLTVSWQYDCCNVYNASAKYTVDINDNPKDVGVFVKEDYSIPEVDPVDLAPCKPCTPKCLRVQLAIVLYAIPLGGIPGQRRQMSLDLRICPGIGGPAFTDKTAYGENRGNDNGSVANPKKGETVPDPATNANNTWGVRPLAGYPKQT